MTPLPPKLRYLALGDSYTIGESVAVDERWPVQLVAALRGQGIVIADPEIVAKTGWTTAELAEGIAQAQPEAAIRFGFAADWGEQPVSRAE